MKNATILVAMALLFFASSALAIEFNTVMVSGRPDGDPLGPQLGAGVDFTTLNGFSINNAGQVAFRGTLQGPGIVSGEDFDVETQNDTAIWRWSAGSKIVLLREDAQAPGLSAGIKIREIPGVISFRNGANITDDGSPLAIVSLKGPGVTLNVNDRAWLLPNAPGVGAKFFRSGDLLPGSPFVTMRGAFDSRFSYAIDPSQHVLFLAQPLQGPGVNGGNNDALIFGTVGSLSVLARKGSQPPSFPANVVYADLPQAWMAFAGNRVAFAASLLDQNEPDPDTSFGALFTGELGSLQLVAKSGDPLPDGSGDVYGFLGDVRINSSGKLLFSSNNAGPQPLIFGSPTDGYKVLAKVDAPAPGTSETFGFQFGSDGPQWTRLTESGFVAFENVLSGPASANQGIWEYDGSTVTLAIRKGGAAGALAGVTLGELGEWALNDARNLVVETELTGEGVSSANDHALWMVDVAGGMRLLLRKGDLFDVDPGLGVDQRSISSIALGGVGFDSKINTLTDDNQLVFSLNFTDGTAGIFTTTVVPEPASLALMMLGLLPVGLRRRRHLS